MAQRSSWHTNLPAASSKILLEGSLDGVGFATELGIARRRVNDHGVLSPAGAMPFATYSPGSRTPLLQVRSWPTASSPAGSFRALAVADLDGIRYEPGAMSPAL